jgi:hypothetical protein
MLCWVESEETRIITIVVGKFYQQKILDSASFKIQNTQSCLLKFGIIVPFARRFEDEVVY